MKRVVLDTNCLLMSIPQHSPYRDVWTRFFVSETQNKTLGGVQICTPTRMQASDDTQAKVDKERTMKMTYYGTKIYD